MSAIHEHDVTVLGAGLAGLSFAYHFDRDTLVLEGESTVGGLVRTLRRGSYRLDLAPHLLHFRSDYVRNLVFNELGLDVTRHSRDARIYYEGTVIPYPFELNLYSLSPETKADCLAGLASIGAGGRTDDAA